MAFMEVSVTQVKEVLRRCLRDDAGLRPIAAGAGVDRKTARHYVEAAALGVDRSGGEDRLTDELIGGVCEAVRPARPNGHGAAWELSSSHQADITAWVDDGHTVAKIGDFLVRRGVEVHERTLQRFCVELCGAGKEKTTVDAARVRRPQDKPREGRQVPFVRGRFFKGEAFVDLADAQRRA